MTRYPRPFKYRRVPAAPPDLCPKTFNFAIDQRAIAMGYTDPELNRFCQLLQIRPPVTSIRMPALRLEEGLNLAKHAGKIISYSISEDNHDMTINVRIKRVCRISPKLLATFPRLLDQTLQTTLNVANASLITQHGLKSTEA